MSHISGGLQPAISLYDTAIKQMRAMKKSKTNPFKNILPELAAMIPVPDDATAMMETVAAITDPTTRLELGRQAVEAGKKYDPKDILKDIKELAIENPITTATMVGTGGLAGLREASYMIPKTLHARSFLRSALHIPTTQTRLPKRLEADLLESINESMRREQSIPIPAKEFSATKNKYRGIHPPVEELIKRKQIDPDELLSFSTGPTRSSELYNTLGKYYYNIDPEKGIVNVHDFYKFYPWLADPKHRTSLYLVRRYIGKVKDTVISNLKGKAPIKDKIRRMYEELEGTSNELEHLGIRHAGSYPIHWKLKATPEMVEKWKESVARKKKWLANNGGYASTGQMLEEEAYKLGIELPSNKQFSAKELTKMIENKKLLLELKKTPKYKTAENMFNAGSNNPDFTFEDLIENHNIEDVEQIIKDVLGDLPYDDPTHPLYSPPPADYKYASSGDFPEPSGAWKESEVGIDIKNAHINNLVDTFGISGDGLEEFTIPQLESLNTKLGESKTLLQALEEISTEVYSKSNIEDIVNKPGYKSLADELSAESNVSINKMYPNKKKYNYLKVKWHELPFTYEDLKTMGYSIKNMPTDPKLKKVFLEGAGAIPKE